MAQEGKSIAGVPLAACFNDFTTALVVCPPDAESQVLQGIRQTLDPSHVDLWPAHVSLVYPFLSRDDIRDFLPALQAAAATVQPFALHLAKFSQFNQKRKGYVTWLSADPQKDVIALGQKLWQAAVDAKRAARTRLEQPAGAVPPVAAASSESDPKQALPRFQLNEPHLTVARGQPESQAGVLQKTWKPLRFKCDKVFILIRKDNKSPMQVLATIALGQQPERCDA